MTHGKVTRENIENATIHLQKLIPHRPLAIEWWEQKARIVGHDPRSLSAKGHSTPFGSNYYTKAQLYDVMWFAINALRIAKETPL